MGKGGVFVVVVVTVVFVVESFSGPFYFGTRETGFGHFVFGKSSARALVFDLKTFPCFDLKIGNFQIRFGKTRRGGLLYLISRHFNVLTSKSENSKPVLEKLVGAGSCI